MELSLRADDSIKSKSCSYDSPRKEFHLMHISHAIHTSPLTSNSLDIQHMTYSVYITPGPARNHHLSNGFPSIIANEYWNECKLRFKSNLQKCYLLIRKYFLLRRLIIPNWLRIVIRHAMKKRKLIGRFINPNTLP